MKGMDVHSVPEFSRKMRAKFSWLSSRIHSKKPKTDTTDSTPTPLSKFSQTMRKKLSWLSDLIYYKKPPDVADSSSSTSEFSQQMKKKLSWLSKRIYSKKPAAPAPESPPSNNEEVS